MRFIKNSIRNKLIILLLTATVVPIATSIVITHQYTKKSVTKQTILENTNLLSQGKKNINLYFDMINKASLSVYDNTYYNETLYGIMERDLYDFQSENRIYRELLFIYKAMRGIHQVYVNILKSNRSYLMRDSLLSSGFSSSEPINYSKELSKAYVEPTHISHNYGVHKLRNDNIKPVISFHRFINKIPSGKTIGSIAIDVDVNILNDMCNSLYTKGEDELYIIDSNSGKIIYNSNNQISSESIKNLNEEFDLEVLKQINSNKDIKGNFKWDDKEFSGIIMYDKISNLYMDWTIVKKIPYQYLYKNARQLTQINSMVVGLFLILVVIITIYISFYFTTPIKRLINYTERIQKGDLKVDIKAHSNDEFGILETQFKEMMNKINTLILEEYKLEIANKTNQIKALQAQINPHFLNNALQSIGTLALQHNAPKVYSLISYLGSMMNYNMNTKNTIVPLSAEIEYVKKYFQLQKQRFDDMFDYYFYIEEKAEKVYVPKMILQPIVENCFKHGFWIQGEKGFIKVSAVLAENNCLKIYIEDNGKGIEKERLLEFKDILKEKEPVLNQIGDHIGFMNVLARLKLYFGDDSGLYIENTEPHGLKVIISIPIKEEW